MRFKKVYLAGQMSGVPFFNFPAFKEAAKKLRDRGYIVFSPAEKDIERAGEFQLNCPNGSAEELVACNVPQITYRECMKLDLNYIMDQAEVIALLPGWEKSPGACVEKGLADLLKLEVIYL